MDQRQIELLPGTGNFPRTDAAGGAMNPVAVAVGFAVRSLAQMAESSRALAPFMKDTSIELKAIRTELQPSRSILASLQNIEKHLTKTDRINPERKAVAKSSFDDSKLDELVRGMQQSIFITETISQNTAYLVRAVEDLTQTRNNGDGHRNDGSSSREPVEAAEEKRNKRLSKTFADSLDNSRMAKEMEKGFRKINAMQTLNSFANAGQGGLTGLLTGVLTNSLTWATAATVIGAAVADKALKAAFDWWWKEKDNHEAHLQKKGEEFQGKIRYKVDELQAALGARGISPDKLYSKMVKREAWKEVETYVDKAEAARAQMLKDNPLLREESYPINWKEHLTPIEQQELARELQYAQEIPMGKNGQDNLNGARDYFETVLNMRQLNAGKPRSQILVHHGEHNWGADLAMSEREEKGTRAAYNKYRDADQQITTLMKKAGYTGEGVTSMTQVDRSTAHTNAQVPTVMQQMDKVMKKYHQELEAGDMAQLFNQESGGELFAKVKQTSDIPPPKSKNNPYGWWKDTRDGKFRPTSAIGLGQFVAGTLADMPGVKPEVQLAAKKVLDAWGTSAGKNDTYPWRDATEYYKAFETAYPTIESQIELLDLHAKHQKIGDKLKGLNVASARRSFHAAHYAGGGVLTAAGEIDYNKIPEEHRAGTLNHVENVLKQPRDIHFKSNLPFESPRVPSGGENPPDSRGSSGKNYLESSVTPQRDMEVAKTSGWSMFNNQPPAQPVVVNNVSNNNYFSELPWAHDPGDLGNEAQR